MHEDSNENPPIAWRHPRAYLYLLILAGLALSLLFLPQSKERAPETSYDATEKRPAQVMTAQPRLPTVTVPMLRQDKAAIPLQIELARTPGQQEKGLMLRTDLQADEGMLFLYPSEEPRRMWMKNTALPLDMLFLAADGAVRQIVANTTPYSEAIIASDSPALAVLELRGGVAAAYEIRIGDRLDLSTLPPVSSADATVAPASFSDAPIHDADSIAP